MIEQLYLNFSIPAWIIFLICWILVAIAIFFYTRTLPPLSQKRRVVLITARAINFIILLSLIFQPVIHYMIQKTEKPTLALLFDNSGSMKINELYGLRGDSLNYALNRLKRGWNNDSVIIRPYRFAENLHLMEKDSLDFTGTRTNISTAMTLILDSLLNYNIRSVLLLSDGIFNEGANPLMNAMKSPVPVFTVTVGDTLPKKDVEVAGVRFNPVVYAGDSMTVTVNLSQTGFTPTNALVRIRGDAGQTVAKTVLLPPSGFQKSVEFTLTPQTAGDFSYRVEIESLPGEMTSSNNHQQFILRVLKNKYRLFLISGQPSFDQRILIHILKQLPNIEMTVLTENRQGRFYEPDFQQLKPDSQDVFIFLGYPTRISDKNYLSAVLASIQKNDIPLFCMVNENTYLANLAPIEDIIPVTLKSRLSRTENSLVRITPGGLLHPATRLQDESQNRSQWWQELPPVTDFGRDLELHKTSSVLVTREAATEEDQVPLLMAASGKDNKSLLLAVSGFGNWHFLLQDDPARETFFRSLIDRGIRWLVSREDLQRIHIKPQRQVYQLGELVEFSGQVFDEFYREVNDAIVNVVIQGDSFQIEDVIPNQGGYYAYRTASIPSGVYEYKIKATSRERLLGEVRGKFAVEQLALEWQETVANISLMKQLAGHTGGKHWRIREFLKNMHQFQFASQTQLLAHELVIWNSYYWLIAIITLLAIEWFFRKRWGLL